ncbi:uroporphyrinogen decarboxylase family protein [Oceanirhabdus seepicola]|uniref:Uroporphyrinogen decarboxylase family protein n=1 Tax=Oceanirhabdus seepicola TaxID=2828781 RepID=A0A9J6P6W7_9CLOT|nr:uroporphyrinogen decarboxylase family protein [Oceanirhabdus seepicola]MCM1991248.1 uroporphyrinogen decarboxylase family protein [Oceanirhabdus seepicola]
MRFVDYINSEERGFFLPDMGTNGLFLTGYSAYEVYTNPQKQVEVAKKMNEIFESDFIYGLCDGVICSEALGLDILKPDYDFPSVLKHPVKNREILRSMKVPDPYKNERMSTNLESLRLIKENIDKHLYVSIQGPFTLAVQLAGATDLLRNIIKDPEFVEELVEFTTEVVLRYVKALNEVGAQYISIAEPSAVMLNGERFDRFVKNYINKIYDELTCWKGLHICGDTRKILDNMLSCHIDAISLDQILDYNEIAPMIPEDIVLIGNIDPIEVLGYMNKEQVAEASLKLVSDMRKYSNYLCAFGCNCLNDTPIENLQTAMRIGRMSYEELDNR